MTWTLADPITRIVMRLGIAYGSVPRDPQLRDPEPSVFFAGLGDSSVDFEVGLFVRALKDRMPLTREFHMCIEHALPLFF